MSAVRRYGPDGRPTWVPVDDGMAPYSPRTFLAGSLVVGESVQEREARAARSRLSSMDAVALETKHAQQSAYYQAHKAEIMAKQRARRQAYKQRDAA